MSTSATPIKDSAISWSPKAYQVRGIELGVSQASLGLLLDPGLGKTSTILAIFSVLKAAGYVDKMLVIAPIKPMYTTWPNEIDKWANFEHLRWCVLHGPDKQEKLSWDADVFLINPEGMKWLEPHLLGLNCDVLAVDESTKFKNSTSKRFKMLRRFIPKFARKMIATGTVCPNGLLDLFGQVYILDEGASLGRYITHYRKKWFDEDWTGYNWEAKPEALDEITEAIAPLCIQINAEEHLDMPELVVVDRPIKLSSGVMNLYKDILEEYIATLPETGRELVALSDAAAGAKCRQIIGGAVYVEPPEYEVVHREKMDDLLALLDEIGEQPAVICYEFRHEMKRIMQEVEGVECMTGVTGDALRDMEQRFNLGLIKRLLVQPTGTHGLNIQGACHHMVWYGVPWDYEAYMQTIYRLYRQGQSSKVVMVYRLLAEDTLDYDVVTRLYAKGETQDDVNAGIRSKGHG